MCTVLAIAMSVAYVHLARFIPLWRISALKVAAAYGKPSFFQNYNICFLSLVSSHSLFQGFRRFSFLAFQNPPPSAGKVYFTLFSRVPKKRMCLRLKENYSFLTIYSQRCFLVFSIFQNPWNAIPDYRIWTFESLSAPMCGRSLVLTGPPPPWKAWKVPLAPAASKLFNKYACGTRGVRIFSLDLGILQNLSLLTFALPL